jgi:hypothetical protein
MEAVNETAQQLLARLTVDVKSDGDTDIYKTKLGLNENLANVHVVSDISKKDYPSRYPVNPLSIQIQTQFYQSLYRGFAS